MGNGCTKYSKISPLDVKQMQQFVICCDAQFNITSISKDMCHLLSYTTQDSIIGQPITILMHDISKCKHLQYFKSIKLMDMADRVKLQQKLRQNMSKCIQHVILDKNRKPIICNLYLDLDIETCKSRLVVYVPKVTSRKFSHHIPIEFIQHINGKPSMNVQNYNQVICIMMDVAGSTTYAVNYGSTAMATMLHGVYQYTYNIIMSHFLPYVYIHETVGDSIFLIINADFMPKIPNDCASIALRAVTLIQRKLNWWLMLQNSEMHLRVGISFGQVTAGVVDGRTFRVFGPVVHLAQRIESQCDRNYICLSLEFVDTLTRQCPSVYDALLKERYADIKGFGNILHYIVDRKRLDRFALTQYAENGIIIYGDGDDGEGRSIFSRSGDCVWDIKSDSSSSILSSKTPNTPSSGIYTRISNDNHTTKSQSPTFPLMLSQNMGRRSSFHNICILKQGSRDLDIICSDSKNVLAHRECDGKHLRSRSSHHGLSMRNLPRLHRRSKSYGAHLVHNRA